jgi:hypothetical protein
LIKVWPLLYAHPQIRIGTITWLSIWNYPRHLHWYYRTSRLRFDLLRQFFFPPWSFPDQGLQIYLKIPFSVLLIRDNCIFITYTSDIFNDWCKESVYSLAKSLNSPFGEYFFQYHFASRSVKISRGSPSLMRKVRRISLGITTLPKSSILRTIPVAFTNFPPFSAFIYISSLWYYYLILHFFYAPIEFL